MKYDFLYKSLGSLHPVVLHECQVFAKTAEYRDNLGFYRGKGIRTHTLQDDNPMLEWLLTELENSGLFRADGYLNSHINILPAGMYIPEHSDEGANKFYQDNLVIHKVHIPLFSNPAVGHTWRCPYEEGRRVAAHLDVGQIYLFNNIDVHSVSNCSEDEDRYHWILRYKEDALCTSI